MNWLQIFRIDAVCETMTSIVSTSTSLEESFAMRLIQLEEDPLGRDLQPVTG